MHCRVPGAAIAASFLHQDSHADDILLARQSRLWPQVQTEQEALSVTVMRP
jgi:hypothetical protein